MMGGIPISKTQVDQLAVGEIRVEKLAQIFGEPDKKETLKPSKEKYIYKYYSDPPLVDKG
jgi:hypothetical protein